MKKDDRKVKEKCLYTQQEEGAKEGLILMCFTRNHLYKIKGVPYIPPATAISSEYTLEAFKGETIEEDGITLNQINDVIYLDTKSAEKLGRFWIYENVEEKVIFAKFVGDF